MNTMITVTANAKERIALLQKQHQGFFHLTVEDKGCNGKKYKVDFIMNPNPQQHEPISYGDDVFYIDKQALPLLFGLELDCIKKELGQWEWEFRNPNAVSSCGCGESFSV